MVDGNQQQQLKYEAVLDKVGLLESLSDDARAKVAAAMRTMLFADGDYIICQVRSRLDYWASSRWCSRQALQAPQ